jgi:ATP-binding cassette subfamily F protein 3
VVFELEDGRVDVPGRTLVQDASMWLERGEHVSLVGPNGSGKTTLLKALTGERPLDGGRLKQGHSVQVGYLSQHGEELEFGGARTVLEAAVHQTGLAPNEARALLGRFLFSGEEAEKPLDGLSGGERKRLGLATLVASGANVLVLDEPTNHLDLESREALEDALASYEGAVLLVTHDRALLDAVGTRTIAVEDHTLRSYVGGWAEYARLREERAERPAGAPPAPVPGSSRPAQAPAEGRTGEEPSAREKVHGRSRSGPSKNRLRRQAELEAAVEQAEAAQAALEEELSAPEAWATAYETAKSQARITAARRAVEAAWAELSEFEESEPATAG